MSDAPVATGASRDLIEAGSRKAGSDFGVRLRANSEYVVIPLIALRSQRRCSQSFCWRSASRRSTSSLMSGEAASEPAFSLQNTLQRSAPLILTALAVAIPARIGLIMIGGEGALVLGGFAAAVLAIPMIGHVPPMLTLIDHSDLRDDRRRLLGRPRRLPALRARSQ